MKYEGLIRISLGGLTTKMIWRRLCLLYLETIWAIAIIAFLTAAPALAKKLKVSVSIPPQADFVRNIVGDSVDILIMVPPGSSPETYELTPAQLRELSGADAYVKIGADFEFEKNLIDRIGRMYPDLKIIDCSAGIELLGGIEEHAAEDSHDSHLSGADTRHKHGGNDPHLWNSPRNAKIFVRNIAAGLIAVDPGDSAVYRRNAARYEARLDSLDRSLESLLRPFRGSKFIVFHPAWGYFARDYDLIQIAVESEGKEPSAAEMIKLIKLARAEDLKTIFISPQFNRENAAAIAREIGGKIETADPLPSDFIGQMLQFGKKLATSYRESTP